MKKALSYRRFLLLIPFSGMIALAPVASAADIASDNASNAPYDDGWQYGDNGGTGFSEWRLFENGTEGSSGYFIGDSTNLSGGSGADINSSGEAFGMYGNSGKEATAYRDFSSALSVGQSFTIQLAVNYRNGFKGIDLRDGVDPDARNTIFNFNVAGDDYVVQNAATGNGSIGNSYSANSAFTLSFTQTSLDGGTWNIIRSGGVSDNDSGTYSGLATGFKLYVGGTDVGPQNDLFANNMAISAVPEPSTWSAVMAALALFVIVYRVRSRKQLN